MVWGHYFLSRTQAEKKSENSDCDSSSEQSRAPHSKKFPFFIVLSPSAKQKTKNILKIHSLSPTIQQPTPFTQDSVFFFLTAFSTCCKFQFWNRFIPSRDLGLFHIKFSSSQIQHFFISPFNSSIHCFY